MITNKLNNKQWATSTKTATQVAKTKEKSSFWEKVDPEEMCKANELQANQANEPTIQANEPVNTVKK